MSPPRNETSEFKFSIIIKIAVEPYTRFLYKVPLEGSEQARRCRLGSTRQRSAQVPEGAVDHGCFKSQKGGGC